MLYTAKMQMVAILIALIWIVLPTVSYASTYGSGNYGSGNYDGEEAASNGGGGGGGGGSDLSNLHENIANNPIIILGARAVPKQLWRLTTASNKAITMRVKIPEGAQTKEAYVRLRGKKYPLRDSGNTTTFTTHIPPQIQPATYRFSITVNYGPTTKTQEGLLVVTSPKQLLGLDSPLIKSINSLFTLVYDRLPTFDEWKYWADRVLNGDKKTSDELLGAMRWQKLFGKK